MILALTEGAKKVLETDPHGLALTLVSVCTVFACLIILFCIYQLLGDIFTGKFKKLKPAPSKGNEDEIAAAIAMALQMEAAGSAHENEPGIITIKKSDSPWNAASRNFRRAPGNNR